MEATDQPPFPVSGAEASALSRKLGQVIRRMRKDLRVNSGTIADALNCSRAQPSRMETGKQNFSIEAAERIAGIFGLKASELIAIAEGDQAIRPPREIMNEQRFTAFSKRLERVRRDLENVCDEARALSILEGQEKGHT
jgi:transcriptional regulator with XRE-family HTH domain